MHGEELLKNERGSGGGGLYREYTCLQIEEGEKGRRGEGEKGRRREGEKERRREGEKERRREEEKERRREGEKERRREGEKELVSPKPLWNSEPVARGVRS